MPESITFNEDCMAVMRRYPDKYFDLAVCDPPYGDGSSQSVNVERERERAGDRRITGSEAQEAGLRSTSAQKQSYVNRGGWHGKDKYYLGATRTGKELQTAGRKLGLRELEEPGRRSMQKNHSVGRSAGTGVF